MSYTYLLESGEVSSAECYSDMPVSVLSRLSRSAERFCCKDNATESRLGRVAYGVADRIHRLKAIGNGQVPLVAATAFNILMEGENDEKLF